MPIFEFRCERCGAKIEKWVSYVTSKFPYFCTRVEDNIMKRCNGKLKKIGVDTNLSLANRGWNLYGNSDKQIRYYVKK